MADISCPCGGTHVQNVSEIKEMDIYKLTVKKGVTRLSYKVL